MDNDKAEKILQLEKKQMFLQRIVAICVIIMTVCVVYTAIVFMQKMSQLSAAAEEMGQAVEKIEDIDVDGVNDAIGSTKELLENVDDLSEAVEEVTDGVNQFQSILSVFGN